MHWRRVAAVQDVTAMIVQGSGAAEDVLHRLAGKSSLFDALLIDRGEDWIAIFAAPLPDETGTADSILPDIPGVPLYEEAAGWWLPVGVEIAAPAHVRASLRQALAAFNDVRTPAIVVPRFACGADQSCACDLYAIVGAVPLGRYRLAAAG